MVYNLYLDVYKITLASITLCSFCIIMSHLVNVLRVQQNVYITSNAQQTLKCPGFTKQNLSLVRDKQ